MFFFDFVRWVRQLGSPKGKTIRRSPAFRLDVEVLENRLAPATHTWTGNGTFVAGFGLWSDPNNWSGGAPSLSATQDDLVFPNTVPAAKRLTENNIVGTLPIAKITVSGDSYTLRGNAINLVNPVTNAAAITVNSGALNTSMLFNIALGNGVASSETITVNSAASLTISGQLSGNSATTLGKDGVGTMTLSGDNSGFQGPFSINTVIGASSVIITNQNALGDFRTSEVQFLTVSNATAGTTLVTMQYMDGVTNPSTNFTFTNSLADATTLQSRLNTLFNSIGIAGNPATVTRTASTATSASFSIAFSGNLIRTNVASFSASASGSATAIATTLAQGAAANLTTINNNTQLQVNPPSAAAFTVNNPIFVSGAGIDGFSGAILMNTARQATLAGDIQLRTPDVTLGGVAGSTLTVTGTISDSTSSNLNKQGAGTMVLDPKAAPSASNSFQGGNTYHGHTNINDGVVQIRHPFALGAGGKTVFANTPAEGMGPGSGSLQISYGTNFVSLTTTSASYVQPSVGAQVTVSFASTSWMRTGQTIYIAGGGYYTVANVINATSASLTNPGSNGNASPGIVVSGGLNAGTPTMRAADVNFAPTQTVAINNPIAGTTRFTLSFNGATTTPITYGASIAATVKARLDALSTVVGINASTTVTQTGSTFYITFGGNLAGIDVATVSASVVSAFGTGTTTSGTTAATEALGMVIPNQYVVLHTQMTNVAGHNTWNQPTANTSTLAIDLSGGQTIIVNAGTTLTHEGLLGGGTLTKAGGGRMILPHQTSISGTLTLSGGALNLRDSQSTNNRPITMSAGTTIELQTDGVPDSRGTAGTYNLFFPSNYPTFTLVGNGSNNEGALYNMSGVNRIETTVNLAGGTINVAPDPDPANTQLKTWQNLSQLIIGHRTDPSLGLVTGGALTKFGFGELVLTSKNTYSVGQGQNQYQTFINEGWITVQNNQALGGQISSLNNGVLQPGVQVASGAAIVLKQDLEGNDLNLPYAFKLAGIGINHRFAWLNQTGALVNLDGNNTIFGEIYLNGAAGVGVQLDGANLIYPPPNQLLITGAIHDGGAAGKLLKLGTERLVLRGEGQHTGGVEIHNGVLQIQNENALGLGSPAANVTTTVNAGTALELGSTDPSFNGGANRGMQVWYNTLVLHGTGNAKFGDAPLIIASGDNVWRGPIVLNSNIGIEFQGPAGSTALPTILAEVFNSASGTVNAITATPGAPGIGAVPGTNAVQVLTFGGTWINGDEFTLVVGNGIALTTTTFDFAMPQVGANVSVQVADSSWMTPGQTVYIANGGYFTVSSVFDRNAVILTNTGAIGNVGAGAVIAAGADIGFGDTVRTAPIKWNSNANILVSNIQAALNTPALEVLFTPNTPFAEVSLFSQIINIFPNARLTSTGGITDAGYPADITIAGGGELNLAGANTYRGTTYLNQGILTVQNAQALGAGPISQIQELRFAGAVPGTTQFTLEFNGETTPSAIPYTGLASDASAVQTALKALGSVGAIGGDVQVTLDLANPTAPVFTFTLVGALSGFRQPNITAPSVSTGTATPLVVTHGAGGTVVADKTQLQLQGGITIAGEPVVLQGKGNPLQSEIQRVNIAGPSYGSFQLTFTNPNLSMTPYTTVSLPMGASATLVENALNALPSIQAGDGTGSGSVAVNSPALNVYSIVFQGTFYGISQPWSQQAITIGGTSGSFELNFTGFMPTATVTPDPLPANTLASLQAALNLLLNNPASPGAGSGTATVSIDSTGAYLVKFGGALADASVPMLQAARFIGAPAPTATIANRVWLIASPSQQLVSVSGSSGTFDISFGAGTQTVTLGANLQTSLQTAINNLLATAGNPGYVNASLHGTATVDRTSTGNFVITYGGTLAGVNGVTLLSVSNLTGGAGASVLPMATVVNTAEIIRGGSANVTPTQWFNIGPAPVANAAVNLSAATNRANVAGPVTSISTDPQDSNIIYIATANGGAFKTYNGGVTWTPLFDSQSTVQQFDTFGVDPAADTYTLTYSDPFTGVQTQTQSLPYNATAEQVQAALNDVVGTGNAVSVSQSIKVVAGVNAVQRMTLRDSRITSGNQQRWIPQTGGLPTPNRKSPTRFQLNYGGFTSPNIAYTGVPLTDLANIQTAVDALFLAVNNYPANTVQVTNLTVAGGDETFQFTFTGGLGQQPVGFIGINIGGADQYWTLYGTNGVLGGPGTPNPVPGTGGFGPSTGRFPRIVGGTTDHFPTGFGTPADWHHGNLTQITAGRRPGLATGVDTVQQISLNTSASTWTSTTADPIHYTRFQLAYNGVSTADIPFTGNATQDALNIQNALNAPGILPPGAFVSVTVSSSSPDEVFLIKFQGTLALTSAAPLTFNIGGAGTNFWLLNPNPQPAPSPFPTINGVPASGTTNAGSLPVTVNGQGATVTNTVTFGGGQLSGVNIAPLVVTPAGTTVVGQSIASPVLTSGAGYTAPQIQFFDPLGVHAGATLATGTVYGMVTPGTINVPAPMQGAGYTSAPTVTIINAAGDTTGSGAAGYATISGDQVDTIVITKGGNNYTKPPVIVLTGGGFTTAATPPAVTLSVTGVAMTNQGSGYPDPASGAAGNSYVQTNVTITDAPVAITSITESPAGTYTVTMPGAVPFSTGQSVVILGTTNAALNGTRASNITVSGVNTFTYSDTNGKGNGTNGTATGGIGAAGIAIVSGGRIVGVNITSGSGYTSAPSLTFGTPAGNAAGVAMISGTVTGVTVNVGTTLEGGAPNLPGAAPNTNVGVGVGYFANPTVNFARGGTGAVGGGPAGVPAGIGAVATAQVNTYVKTITVTGGGSGYSGTPTVMITQNPAALASGNGPTLASTTVASKNAFAVANMSGDVVQSVTVQYGGEGYDFYNPPQITFTGVTFTTAATAFATLDSGVFGITPSAGYTGDPANGGNLNVTLTGGGSGAGFTPATVSVSGGVTAISSPNVTAPFTNPFGVGVAPRVDISAPPPGGTQATAVAYINAGGTQVSVAVTNPGSGYITPPTVTYTDRQGSVDIASISEGSGVYTVTTVQNYPFVNGQNVTISGTSVLGLNGNKGPITLITANTFSFTDTAGLGNSTGGSVRGDTVGAASPGSATLSVQVVQVLTPGSGYTSPPTVTFPDATGRGAQGLAEIDTATGQLTKVLVTTGQGYGSPPLVYFTGGTPAFGLVPGTLAAQHAVATATISGSVSGIYLSAPGDSYTSAPPSVNFSTPPALPTPVYPVFPATTRTSPATTLIAATGTATLQTTVLQSGTGNIAAMSSGAIAIDQTAPGIVYFGTGEGNNTSDSFYGSGVYRSIDFGRTWNLLVDPTLVNLFSPGNPLYGLAVNKIVLDVPNKMLYVATSDLAANGLLGTNARNQPFLRMPGVWRYDLANLRWMNLTNLNSPVRLQGHPPGNAPNPGPDDFFNIDFPQQQASWTDLALVGSTLYATLGTATGGAANGIYYLSNGLTANDSNNPPTWLRGSTQVLVNSPASYPIYPAFDTRNGSFPFAPGNIRLAAVGGSTLFATLIDPASFALNNFVQSNDGGVTWFGAPSPGNFMANNGQYATALTNSGGTLYVGGTDSGGTPYVLFYNGVWNNISTVANNAPHTDIHAIYVAGGNVYVGTDGGIWKYNGQWTSINGNLANVQINGLASDPTNPNSVFAVGRGISIAKFTGNQTWSQAMGIPPASTGNLNGSSIAIDPNNPQFIYEYQQGQAASGTARLFSSSNGGASWVTAGPASATTDAPVVVDKLSRAFAGGTSFQVFDRILNPVWAGLLNSPPITSSAIAVAELQGPFVSDARFTSSLANVDHGANGPDRNTVYVTDGSVIRLTKDFGLTAWQSAAGIPNFVLAASPNPRNRITDIQVDPRNRDTIYAVVGGSIGLPITGTVWKSTDAGQSWTNISTGLPAATGLTTITVSNRGSGYTLAPTVTLIGGGGSGATAIATLGSGVTAGQVVSITLTNAGTGYTSAPTVVLSGGGYTTPATAFASAPQVGALAGIAISASGSGYSAPPTITIDAPPAGGIQATAVATILHGVVTGVTLTSAGAGYVSTPTVTLSAPTAPGATAQASAYFGGAPAWKLALDPRTDQMYLATDRGVFQYNAGTVNAWSSFGKNLPQVAVRTIDLNQSTNILTAGTAGRGAYQFFIDTPTVNTGALYAASGSNIWGGPVILAGPTTVAANGNQALQNGVALTQLTFLGVISDQSYSAFRVGANTLTKIGGGNVTMAGPAANIFSGTAVVQEGNLIIQNPDGLAGVGIVGEQQLFIDNAAVNRTQFELYFDPNNNAGVVGTNLTNVITYTGVAATDAANIQAELRALTTINNQVTVTPNGVGNFLITFSGTLAGITRPLIIARVTQGVGSAYAVNVGGTVVADGSILQLKTGLNDDRLFLFGNGITNNGHFTGALQNVSGNNTYTGTITLMTNATIGVDSTSSLTITSPTPDVRAAITDLNGGPTGRFNLTKEGTGRLTLSSVNSYEGNTTVNQGVLNLQHSGALGTGGTTTTTVLDLAQLQLEQGASGPVIITNQNLALSGTGIGNTGALVNVAGNNTWGDASHTVTMTSAPSFAPQSLPGGVVSFAVNNANETLTIGGPVVEATAHFSNPAAPVLTLGAGLVKVGPGTLTLTQNDTYHGTTYVQEGILNIQESNSLGANIGNAVQRVTFVDPTLTGTFRLTFNGRQTNPIPFRATAALVATELNGLTSIGANGVSVAMNEVYSGISEKQQLTFSNAVAGTTQFTLSFNGSTTGFLVFNGAATATTIETALNGAFGSIGGLAPFSGTGNAGKVTVTADPTGTIFTITFGGQLQAQPLALATVAVTSGPGTGAAAIERTQAGSGRPTDVYTVTFSGAAFAGQAVSAITASTSTAGASVAVSKVADGGITAIVSPGAALYLDSDPTHNNSSLSTPATQTLILNGAGPNNAGALRNVSGNNTWQGPITLQSSSTFAADATTQLTVSGVVRDPSPAPVPPASVIPPDVTKIGQGTLAFSNANTYTGNTFINNGIVNIQNANALGEANSTQQTVDVSGSGGTFTLSFTGFPWLSTPALPTNVNAASLAFELNNILTNTLIPALGGGNGRVSVNLLSNGSTFVVTFTNALKGKNVPLLVAPQATQLGGASVSTGMLLPGGASKTIVATGATLQIQNTNENAGKPLVLNGAGFNNLGALHNLAGNNTWNDLPITLGSDTAFGASAGTLDITQPIVDTNSSGVNQNFKVTKVGGGTVEFSGKTGTLASVVGQGLGGNITSVVGAAGVVTVTTSVAHTLVSGNLVTINGTSTGLDGNTYFVTVVNATQYRLVGVGTTLNSSTGTWSYPVIVTTTAADNSLRTGESVMVNAVAGFAAANGTFPIIAIAPNQFALAGTSVAGTATPNTGVWSIGNNYTGLTDVHQGTLQLNVTNPVNPAVASPSLAVLRDLQVGDATPVGQVHTLDLSTFNYGNQFTLAYNSSPASAPITYYTNPTFAAALIQTTLNGLSTIGGLATPGSVTVTPQGGGIFAITFGGSLAGAIAFTPITAHNNTTSADRNSTQSSPGAAFALNSAIAQLLQSNQIATTSAVTVNSDGLFDINAQVQRIAQLSVNRGTTTTNAAATGAGTLNVIGTNGISLTGGATLTTQGTGSQVNVTGPLTANASNVLTPGVNSQVNVTGTMTATSSTLGDSGTGTGSQINVIGTLTSNASTFTESAGASQINVTGTFNANANTVVTLAGANTQVNVTGPLNETDATFTASGASSRITVDGVLNMTGGTINLQHATSQLVLGANGSVTATSNAGGPATVSGAGAFALNGNDCTFTVNDGTNTTDLFVGAKITGTGTEKLVKTGPGRLELGAVNTYTGLTQIVNGDVQVDGGAQIAGVEFNGANPNEASLSGNGTVGAVTMASGAKGTVSPGINTAGNHTGSLTTTSDVTWNNNAKFSVDLAYNTGTSTPSNDVLHVTGNLTLNDARLTGTATLGIPLNQPYTIANYTGTLTGFFTGSLGQIAQGGAVFISGQKFQVDYGTRSNSAIVLTRVLQVLQSLSLAAVPAASNYGQAVVFKATAQPENGAGVFPTGLVVDFVLDAGPNQITQTGVPVNTTTGEAFFDPQTLAGFTLSRSSHTVDATFRDTNSPAIYQGPVNASQFSYTVNKSDVGVGVSSSPLVTTSTPIYGQPTTVTATITPAPAPVTAYASNPTNTATFNLDGGGGLRTFTGPVTHSIQLVGFSNAQQFTLTYGGTAVGPITYSSTQATTAANIQTLLNTPAILGAGKSVAVNTTAAVDVFSLTFGGGLANTNGAYMTGAPVGAPAGRSVNANLLTASWTIPISVLDVSAGHALQVSYDGDTNYNQSPAPTNFTLPVFVDGSNVEFRFSPPGIYPPNHSELGQNASFYVVVSPQAAGSSGVPQGTVNFYDNLTTSPPLNASPVALVNGVATFQTAALAAGPHNIVAVFTPSNSNYTGNSKTTSFTVDPAQTTVTFDQVNPTTPTYGNSVAFTIKVTPQDPGFPTGTFGSPAGTVTLWKNAVGTSTSDPNYLGTGSLNAVTGKTTITTVPGALPQGDLTIIAHYVGSTSFAANDGTLSPLLHVNPATTNTGLSASPSSGAVYGQNVTLVATITSPAGTPPAGSTVTFWDGPVNTGINLGTRFTDSLGRATLVTNALSVGNHPQINAVFTDTVDTNFDTSTGTILNYSVGQAPTKIVMGATPSAGSNYGMQVTFTATVSADTPGSGLPTDGTVVFTDSVIGFLGNGTLGAGGVYSYQTTSTQLTVGFHTITASFSGDTNLQNKTGQLTNYNVQPAVTTVSLLQSSNLNAVYGEAVQFSATISAIGGAPAPTSGVVTFKNGATVLGTANLTGTNVAVYTIMTNPPQLAVGNGHQITATFGGFGPNYSASPQSAAISQNVAAADTDIPALTFTSSPINPGVGQTVTISAIVVALPNSVANVNAGTVTFVDTTTGLTLGGGPATVSVSGFASVTTTFATTGPHVITAKYNGFSPNFNASPTRTISSNVNVLRATSVNVSAVANTFGQNLVYTLTVTSPQGGVPTGTVTLKEGATTLGNVGTLANVGSVATTTITVPGGVLNAGPHTLTFTYHDTSVPPVYADGVTTLNPQTVAPSGTAITFTPAPQTTAIYGTTVTYAGVVRTTVNQSINLNGQTHNSTLIDGLSSTAQLGVGMSVTGTGIPANTAIASIGSPTSITLTTAATTTAATALTFGGINPTAGTVTLKDATTNTTLGTFNLSGSNAFNFPSVSLPLNVNAGAHSITATFTPGSANYNASPAARSPLTISAAQTQIAAAPISSVTSGPLGGSYFGQQVKFTATVTATNSPATPTGGTVSFFLNGSTTPMGTVALGAGGIAEFTTTPTGLPVNTTTGNKITARYNGSTNFQANTVVSPQRTQFVSKAETGVTITPTSASIVFGQSVTFTAVVSVSSPGSPGTVPTTGATVSFYNGASPTPITGTLTLVSATAPVTYRFTTSALPASATPHSITAKYSGVGNFAASPASNAASVTVAQSGSTVRLTASPTVLATDKINTFTVVVTRTTGSGTITAAPAMVTINDFGNPIGTATLVSSTTSTATYRYTAPANSLADGPHQITAVYSGNTNVAGNTSNLIPQVVHKFSSLALVASASPMATLPVTFTATLTGLNGVPIGPGAQVTFTINGQTFTATTNASGVAKVTYTFSTAGTYKITAVFATDGIYNGVTNTLTTIVQPKVSGRLV